MYVCTVVIESINLITSPRADALARYTVERERATLHVYTGIYTCIYIHFYHSYVIGASSLYRIRILGLSWLTCMRTRPGIQCAR